MNAPARATALLLTLATGLLACGTSETSGNLEDLPALGSDAPSEQSADPSAVTDAVDADLGMTISPATGYEDPVCRMAVAKDAANRFTHDGVTYGFCSAACEGAFSEDPDAFLVAMEE